MGGDEFAILTDDAPDLKRSLAMADRLTRELRVPYVINDHTVSVTASIGIASARDGTDTAEEVVRNADVAMYMAKANGKAGFAVFDPGMHAAMRDRHELGAQLQHAVELGQLRLVYQPIVDLRDGSLAGVEALVRWQHPERGLVTPGEFIEIAEENGAILPIGKWVLREACREANTWAGMAPETFLCVNVSAREIQQPGFVDAVQEALADAGMGAARLSLEITETALLKATPSTVATLESLRDLGVRVVIDDFGTGYFSLSHLRQFPVDVIKIASEFVQVPDTDSKTAALAGAIVAMGRSLDIKTVAEGIETAEQAARMRDLGCSYGQGYFFAKPVAAERVGTEAFAVGDLLPAAAPADDQTAAEPGADRPSLRWPFGDPAARRRRRSDRGQPRLTGRATRERRSDRDPARGQVRTAPSPLASGSPSHWRSAVARLAERRGAGRRDPSCGGHDRPWRRASVPAQRLHRDEPDDLRVGPRELGRGEAEGRDRRLVLREEPGRQLERRRLRQEVRPAPRAGRHRNRPRRRRARASRADRRAGCGP